jgi:hypothetical protein
MATTPVFKPYDSGQLQLLPPSLEELVPANHPDSYRKKGGFTISLIYIYMFFICGYMVVPEEGDVWHP